MMPTANEKEKSLYAGLFTFFTNYISIVAVVFGIIYACSLTFVYVEGDDAASVAYHALGRNPSVQPPYSAYHGMMDVVLGVLPANEPLLRVTAISLTALCAVAFVIFSLTLVFDWLGEADERIKSITALVILIAAPEIFYLGMIYTPSIIAIAFVLASHLLVRKAAQKEVNSKNIFLLLLSVLLFGFGTACRWDIGSYGLVIFADLLLNKRVVLAFIWGLLAGVSALLAVNISGYGINDIFGLFNLAQKEVTQEKSIFALIGAYQTLFTPAFLLFLLIGFISLLLKQKRLAVLVVVSFVPVMPFLLSREPKMLLPALPAMFLCVATGFKAVWLTERFIKVRSLLRVAVCLLLIAPWLISLRVETADTTWGPGFDVYVYDRFNAKPSDESVLSDKVNSRRMSLNKIYLHYDGGFAVPTPEGVRPIGGHAAVLLGGGWRGLVSKLSQNRFQTIERARSLQIPIVQKDDTLYLTAHLLQMGFTTADAPRRALENGLVERRFIHPNGEQLSHYFLIAPVDLFQEKTLNALAETSPQSKVVLYSIHSPTRKQLYLTAPDAVETINSFSLVLDVRRFQELKPFSNEQDFLNKSK